MRATRLAVAVVAVGLASACSVPTRAPDPLGSSSAARPEQVTTTPEPSLRALVAGRAHACALLPDGTARCWGANELGQLGDGTRVTRSFPVVVKGLAGASKLLAWQDTTCALSDAGKAWCWGALPWTEPVDPSKARGFAVTAKELTSPRPLRSLAWDMATLCSLDVGGKVQCVNAGRSHELRLTYPAEQLSIGEALVCAAGRDLKAECFDATDPASEAIPLGLEAKSGLAVYGVRVCALDHERVQCLQPVTRFWKKQPVRTRFDPPVPSGDVKALLPTGHVVMKDGVVAQLGWVATKPGFEATRVTAWKQLGEGARSMAFGEEFACALHDAEVRCFGDNTRGQLGRGDREASLDATPVENLLGDPVASPPAPLTARIAADKRRPDKLLKYIHVWENARIFSAPSLEAARGRLADWEDALRQDPYDGRFLFKVIRREGDFVEVASPAAEEIAGRCAPPLAEVSGPRTFVHVEDLAPLLAERHKISFGDDQALVLAAGSPLYFASDGKVAVDVFGTRLSLLTPAEVAWSTKELGMPPRVTGQGVHAEGTTLRLGPHVIRIEHDGVRTQVQGKEEPKQLSADVCSAAHTLGLTPFRAVRR